MSDGLNCGCYTKYCQYLLPNPQLEFHLGGKKKSQEKLPGIRKRQATKVFMRGLET